MAQVVTAIGQDSHRFAAVPDDRTASSRPLILGGILIPGIGGLDGNSDADVVLHAVTNAVSGISGVNVLGAVSDEMCLGRGITDSSEYLRAALATLGSAKLVHISVSIECLRPKLADHIAAMRESIARIAGLPAGSVGVTATSGEGLTDFGRGLGIQAICIVTAKREEDG